MTDFTEENEILDLKSEADIKESENLFKRSIIGIISYFGISYIVVIAIQLVLTILMSIIYPQLQSEFADYLSVYNGLLEDPSATKEIIDQAYNNLLTCMFNIKVTAWANILVSGVNFLICSIIYFKALKKDFNLMKKDAVKVLLTGFVGAIVLVGSSMIINAILYLVGVTDESINQQIIILICENGYLLPMFFLTCIFAPVVEELIFRKSIFSIIKNPIIACLVSTFLFGAIHVISGGDWIYLTSYATSGLILSLIYIISGKNIWATIFTHFLNNGFSFLMIVLSMIFMQ